MNNKYESLYKSKLVSVDEALSHIQSNDSIVIGAANMEPHAITSRLHTLRGKVKNINVMNTATFGLYPYMSDPEMKDTFQIDSFFYQGSSRQAFPNGHIGHMPANLHDCFKRRLDYKPVNVYIGSASPMDEHGFVYLSMSLYLDKDAIEAADLVIIEINPNMPRVLGDTELHISDIDYIVEANSPLTRTQVITPSPEEKQIGAYIADMVEDGSTIQLGIGGIPDAAATQLMGKKDLGIHTELITPSMRMLMESGVVTNKKKTLNPGKTIGTFIMGDQQLYDFCHNNPVINLKRGCYTNAFETISAHEKMVSINSSIQVDLTGQVCSESIGTRMWSGTGGQFDFAYGASHSKGGKSIIALKSTAKNGTISTICPMINPGAVVTLSRNVVDYIVTEYGVAPMRGRNIAERVENLIKVAHPKFRDELRKEADKLELR